MIVKRTNKVHKLVIAPELKYYLMTIELTKTGKTMMSNLMNL